LIAKHEFKSGSDEPGEAIGILENIILVGLQCTLEVTASQGAHYIVLDQLHLLFTARELYASEGVHHQLQAKRSAILLGADYLGADWGERLIAVGCVFFLLFDDVGLAGRTGFNFGHALILFVRWHLVGRVFIVFFRLRGGEL
jgi:hypothetical protein